MLNEAAMRPGPGPREGAVVKAGLRNTFALSLSYMVRTVAGLATAKVVAVMLGPTGYGRLALYQGGLGILALITSMGGPAALTRLGARLVANGNLGEWVTLQRITWGLMGIVFVPIGAILFIYSTTLGMAAFGTRLSIVMTAVLVAALVFNLNTSMQNGVLRTEQRVLALARADAMSPVAAGLAVVVVVMWLGRAGIVYAVLASALASSAVLTFTARTTRSRRRPVPSLFVASLRLWLPRLWRFSLPYQMASVAGSGLIAAVPFFVLHDMGPKAVGLWAVANAVGGTYLGFLVSAMGRDYYPRLAALPSGDIPALGRVIDVQQQITILIGLPAIALTMTLTPFIIPVIYTTQFWSGIPLVQWVLTGDLVGFLAKTEGFAVLAHLPYRSFVKLEVSGSMATAGLCLIGMRLWGLSGLGIGMTGGQLLYLSASSVILYRAWHFKPSRSVVIHTVVALTVIATLRWLVSQAPTPYGLGWEVLIVGCTVAMCLRILRQRWYSIRTVSHVSPVEAELPSQDAPHTIRG